MTGHKPVRLYFPAGVPAALAGIAAETGFSEQHSALTLWQLQRRLVRNIIERQGKLLPEHYLVPMNSTILQQKIRDKAGYVNHMEALVRHNVLEMKVGHDHRIKRSRQYAYTARFDPLGKQEVYLLTKPTVINAFLRSGKGSEDWYFRQRQEYLREFDLDSDAAFDWACAQAPLEENPNVWLSHVMHTIGLIESRHLPLTKDEYDREHHPFLWLPRHIRKNYVTHDGQQLVQLDLPAAQPLLLYAELAKRIDVAELTEFRTALQQNFYLYLGEAWRRTLGGPVLNRKGLQTELFRYLFGRVRHDLEISKVMRACFPRLYKALASIKRGKGYASISNVLQAIEARNIFSVCRTLTDNKLTPYFTVHDCITTLPKFADRVDQILLSRLKDEGINWITTLRKE